MQPALADAVAGMAADGITRITLVPLFLAQGGHLKGGFCRACWTTSPPLP